MRTTNEETNPNFNATNGTMIQKASKRIDVSAIHYKAAETQDSQFAGHSPLNEIFFQNVQYWRKSVTYPTCSHSTMNYL